MVNLHMPVHIALIGDYNAKVIAHQAIPLALELSGQSSGHHVTFDWKHTANLTSLDGYHGVWCVPASPYANEANALKAITWARQAGVPFLGTCGGFQHAVLEFARNVLNMPEAQHAETASNENCLVVSRLECSLVEVEQNVVAVPGSLMEKCYGSQPVPFGYHCNFGLNRQFESQLQTAGMQVTARDEAGEVRAMELRGHPFFFCSLFQPERQALKGSAPPIVIAFVEAARACKPKAASLTN